MFAACCVLSNMQYLAKDPAEGATWSPYRPRPSAVRMSAAPPAARPHADAEVARHFELRRHLVASLISQFKADEVLWPETRTARLARESRLAQSVCHGSDSESDGYLSWDGEGSGSSRFHACSSSSSDSSDSDGE